MEEGCYRVSKKKGWPTLDWVDIDNNVLPMPVLLRNKKGDPLWAAFLFWIEMGSFFLADFFEVDVGNLFVSTA